MEVVTFRWLAKYGHFLVAGTNTNMFTYPVPPRTAILGLLGAILGLEKDSLNDFLERARIAISGPPPRRFWQTVKFRQDETDFLPYSVERNAPSFKQERLQPLPKLIPQELLWHPEFRIFTALPENPDLFSDIEKRIRQRRWHFSPCMGLSEFLADIVHESTERAQKLPQGTYPTSSLCLEIQARLKGGNGIAVRMLRMPREVSQDRVFRHASYYMEHKGRAITVETKEAWKIGDEVVMFC